MTVEQHTALLETLAAIKGKFLLSGYPSELYTEYAEKYDWNSTTFFVANHAASGKTQAKPNKKRYGAL